MHYYLPIPTEEDIKFEKVSNLKGIKIEENLINNFLLKVIIKYRS